MKKNVTLEVDGVSISGQLLLPGDDSRIPYPTVCVCHGIPASSPRDPGDGGYPLLAEKLCHEGLAVFIFNFRGTGSSGGNFDISGWTKDLRAAINYLWALSEVDRSRLSLLGFSAGAAVSIYVASRDKRASSVAACACPVEFNLITEADDPHSVINRFRNIGIIRDKDFPPSVENWLSGFKMVSPVRSVTGIAPRPLLLVHGSQDEVVPVSHAYKLYKRAREPKQLIIVDGAGHRLRRNDKVIVIITDWFKSHA